MRFYGLCIDGPLDGKTLDSSSPHHKIPYRPAGVLNELNHRFDPEASAEMVRFYTVTYYYTEFPFNEGTIGLWLLEGTSAYKAVKTLLECYAHNAKETSRVR